MTTSRLLFWGGAIASVILNLYFMVRLDDLEARQFSLEQSASQACVVICEPHQ
jgi:hypothetical protein